MEDISDKNKNKKEIKKIIQNTNDIGQELKNTINVEKQWGEASEVKVQQLL